MRGAGWFAVGSVVALTAACRGTGGNRARPADAALPDARVFDDAGLRDGAVATLESFREDRPMGLRHAIARTDVAGAIHLVLGDAPLTCDALRQAATASGTRVHLSVGRLYSPDGTWRWRLLAFNGERGDLAPARVSEEVPVGEPVEVTLSFDARGRAGQDPIAVRGTIVAIVCEESDLVPGSLAPGLRRSSASLTVAGLRLPIAGARVTKERIQLSTERGGDCVVPDDASHRLYLWQWIAGPSARKWTVGGLLLDGGAFVTAKGLNIQVGPTRDVGGKPVADLTLAGSARLGKWSVAIDGTVEADVCGP